MCFWVNENFDKINLKLLNEIMMLKFLLYKILFLYKTKCHGWKMLIITCRSVVIVAGYGHEPTISVALTPKTSRFY